VLALASAACSLGDFDSLGAGPDQNVGGRAGAAGSGGSAGDGGSGGSAGSAGDAGSAGVGGSSGEPTNLIPNPGFEGASSWSCIGNCSAAPVADNPRSGTRCLLTTNRTMSWEGPSLNLMGKVSPAESYLISVWVRSQPSDDPDAGTPESYPVKLTHKRLCASTDPTDGVYTNLVEGQVTGEWGELATTFTTPDCSDLQESVLYIDNAPIGASYCIDDTSLTLAP
jgi:hypothetical protein